MRTTIIAVSMLFLTATANAQSSLQEFTVPTPGGGVLVESVGSCASKKCPAVLILSGSKGFGAPVYGELGKAFEVAGMNAYLVHVLSAADLNAIASIGGASGRIAYYARRWPQWTSAVQSVAAYLRAQAPGEAKVGILGISLGAQIAAAASAGRSDIDGLVLVDGGFPNGYSKPVRLLPPLLLIWGSADRTFPLAIGEELQQTMQRLGRPVELNVFEGGAHDFFLRSGTRNADAARRKGVAFLASYLLR
ncbi:dienelactone hydrolase family protein [Rhizobium sp. ICMP 5592]|uniref:dienelactone hydrolase family protein n=1 Tax=Rhizobium sp. ICMP 5592 TaxID=2292445 RepID=UPI0012976761|nr:dienelactone hydrolase family protein [Rhizobium sp. ICMP 5592]MQB46516.1 alpha/beta hydrolase [Rhizobium sp. ICMP 5592]